MAEEPTFDKTTRSMVNEYNQNHKDGFVDVWAAVDKMREKIELIGDKLPNWAVYYISFLCFLVGGLLSALVAIIVTFFN